jgi:hypothetical protein
MQQTSRGYERMASAARRGSGSGFSRARRDVRRGEAAIQRQLRTLTEEPS